FLAQVQQGDLDPAKFLGDAANLMGFKLADLVDGSRVDGTPQILSDAQPGQPPKVTMLWRDVPLKSESGLLVTSDASKLTVDVTLAPNSQKVVGTVKEIALVFPDRDEEKKLLEVHVRTVEFTQEGGGAPRLDVDGVTVKFFGFLKLLEKLQDAVKLDNAPAIEASDRGVTATFDLPVPDVTTGGFQLTGLTFHSVIDVPFDPRPVSIELAFASREDPFNVSILGLGGGGYVDIALDSSGLKRLEIALEFGASLEVNFFVATGEVHAMGGIRVAHENGLELAGYLRFGGMVEVLGLVSVSIELVVTLEYVDSSNAMIGRATLVLEVDLLLFSDSVELDSGPWVLAGDTPVSDTGPLPPGLVPEPVPLLEPVLGDRLLPADFGGVPIAGVPIAGVDPEAWRSYRAVFDEAALP
ncbi:MAG TPA: hypothetical protein VEY96_13980, partial [Actinomycetes bacterium]|nr:hypothetical protein [Actinomycetes bacterium]